MLAAFARDVKPDCHRRDVDSAVQHRARSGHSHNAPVQRRRVSAVRCNRLLAGQTYFNRFIGGAIHLHTSASTFRQ
jgi:hypothetical protein